MGYSIMQHVFFVVVYATHPSSILLKDVLLEKLFFIYIYIYILAPINFEFILLTWPTIYSIYKYFYVIMI